MKNLGLIDYLYLLKPIYMGLLFAAILFACNKDGKMAEGASKDDTTQDATPYGKTGPTAEPDCEMNSGDILQNATFTHVFTKAGEFPYFCRYHGGPKGTGMAAIVRVTAPGTPGTSNAPDTADSSRTSGTSVTPRTYHVAVKEYAYPDLDIHVGDTVIWTNATSATHTVETVE